MTLLGKLVFLVATSIVTAQGFDENREENSHAKLMSQEQLAQILQAPLFRSNVNLAGQAQGYPNFASQQTYDVSEPKELAEETKATATNYAPVPVPSAILLPPRADALDSYANYRTPDQTQVHPNTEAGPKSYNAKTLQYTPRYLGPILNSGSYLSINPHTKQYDLPLPPQPATELQAPIFEAYIPFNTKPQPQQPLNQYNSPNADAFSAVPAKTLEAPYSIASQSYESAGSESIKPARTPTQYYPKKYNSNSDDFAPKKGGKSEFDGDELVEVTKLWKEPKPQKLSLGPVQPQAPDSETLKSYQKKKETEKQRLKFEESQKKIQFKKEQQQLEEDTLARATANSEPIASESGFNDYHEGPDAGFESEQSAAEGLSDAHGGAGGDRTEFRMHGQHGPHSYEFGYDTGKGKARQFRYEQRDNDGYVKGHYGFYDKHGKLQVVNYDAHPHHGYHAESSFGKV